MNIFVTILIITACLELCSVRSQSNSIFNVTCADQQEACVCEEGYHICRFQLEVEELQTFTSYHISKKGQIITRGTPGDTYYLDRDGFKLSLDNDFCASNNPPECGRCRTEGMGIPAAEIETFRNGLNEMYNCSIPMTVDGRTYRLFIAVNGRIPGPTLVVTEGQEVIVEVYNRLTSEGITIHWHGIHQRGTPWMDGVASLSHIPIVPGGHFQYKFNATPAGTHWYHSHLGAQRTDGLFGGLIVREHDSRRDQIETKLNVGSFIDMPNKHTLSLLDWQRESSLNLFVQIHSTLGFYPNKALGEIPLNANQLYNRTSSSDGIEVGPVPFFSGLINGRGRYSDTTYSILSIFSVNPQEKYRFRLIGAQSLYAFRFEIEGHKLNVIATDGHLVMPTLVDYIIVHSGERYDFIPQLLDSTTSPMNYFIRATTLESNLTDRQVHAAEAILHYEGAPPPNMDLLYNNNMYVPNPSGRCSSNVCRALNCPFKVYPPSYNIQCINVNELASLFSTEESKLPTLDVTKDQVLFFNFGFEGQSSTSAINGVNFLPPATPYQTYPGQYEKDVESPSKNTCKQCVPGLSEDEQATRCTCINVKEILKSKSPGDGSDKSIIMVFSAVGNRMKRNRDFAHPIHLHGHSFHVVGMGYGLYDNGQLTENSPDIMCDDISCMNPSWRAPGILNSGKVNKSAILKDTVLLPAGGYVVVAFQADNPGYWFLHCHIEVHQLEGMAVIIKEYDEKEHPQAPKGINVVGDFSSTDRATPRPWLIMSILFALTSVS